MNYLAEILYFRFSNSYKKSIEYLQQSLECWDFVKNTTGRRRTIHNLGLVNYIAGNLSQAFIYLNEYFESIREKVSIQDNVKYFLILIELLTELTNTSEAKKYLEKLKTFINYDLLYEDEIQLADAFLVRQTQTLSYQIISLKIFDKLTEKNKSDYEIKLRKLLNHLDLMLIELKLAQTNEVLTITEGLVKQLLDYSNNSYEVLAQTTILIESFKNLRENKKHEIPFNAVTLKELNPELHSISKIIIILYILPRKGVTDDELKEVTEINKEKVTEMLLKLLQNDFISSEELIIQEKKVITYKMTEKGIREFEMYIRSLTEIIQGFFVG